MSDEQDVEDMLKRWDNLDDLTLAGLYVLRDVVEKTIEGRVSGGEDYTVRLPLPSDPRCQPCWSCRTWIDMGEHMFIDGSSGKTYHRECKP